jgi:hypothetical protein
MVRVLREVAVLEATDDVLISDVGMVARISKKCRV